MTNEERIIEQNAGLEKETAAEHMRWNVYKRTAKGWVPVTSKSGDAFGAWGHFKAQGVLRAISEKPWNKGVAFALFNKEGKSYSAFLFGSSHGAVLC